MSNYCDGCGDPAPLDGRTLVVNQRRYCSRCFALAADASTRMQQEQPSGTFQMLPHAAQGSPENPREGQIWIDTMSGQTKVFTRNEWLILRNVQDGHMWLQSADTTFVTHANPPEPDPEPLIMWTIYKNPSDFAGRMEGDVFVLRRWRVGVRGAEPDRKPVYYSQTLSDVRDYLPAGLTCMSAGPDDDPAVLETWF